MAVTTHKNSFLAPILLLLLGFIWSFSFICARFATSHGISSTGYSFWYTFGTAALSFAALKFSGKKLSCSKENLRFYFFCGLLGIAVPNAIKYSAAPHLTAGMLGVLINSSPLLVYVLSVCFRVERFLYGRFIGVLCGVAGVLLVVSANSKLNLNSAANLSWNLIALLTPLCLALTTVYIAKNIIKTPDYLTLISGMLLVAALLQIPLTFVANSFYRVHLPLDLPEAAVLFDVILSSIGYIILFKLLHLVGPVYYSLVDGVAVIATPFLGMMFFSEKLNYLMAVGMLLILTAIVLVSFWQKAARIDIDL